MNIDIRNPDIVKLIVNDIESPENKDRKKLEWDAYMCTQGSLKSYVQNRLSLLFPKHSKKMRVSDISISKKVIDKIAKAYSIAPIRSIESDNKDVQDEFATIYKDSCFNYSMREFDSIFNLHRQALMWVKFDENEQEFEPMALRPFEYDLVRDPNTGKVLCVILNYPDQEITMANMFNQTSNSVSDGVNQLITESQFDSGTQSKVYAMWTDEAHVVVVFTKKEIKDIAGGVKYQYAVTYVPIPNNEEMVNPLGELPFVYKQKTSASDYPVHNQITEQTINFNILYSDLLTAASMQGFGQAIFSYPENSEVRELEIGYMSAIRLPQSTEPNAPKTEFSYANANPDLEGQRKTYLNYLHNVLSEHGINNDQAIDGGVEKFASGLDRLIANADVQWLIQENQECYQEVENEMFDVVKAWNKLMGNNLLETVDDIKIYYPKPTIQISDTDKLNNIKMLLDLRLKTRAQALMMLDPNLSIDQATNEISEVDGASKKLVAAITPKPLPPTVPAPVSPGPVQNDQTNNDQANTDLMN